MSEQTRWSSTDLYDAIKKGSFSFASSGESDEIIDSLILDSELNSLNVAIHLRENGSPASSLRLLDRVRNQYSNGFGAFYESAVAASRMLQYEKAKELILVAISSNTNSANFRSFAVQLHASFGNVEEAQRFMRASPLIDTFSSDQLSELAQFIDYCQMWPVADARIASSSLKNQGAYANGRGVCEAILGAVRDNKPFSFVRLGDGEGAWLSINGYDEGKYSKLYENNRRSFLIDWFGSDRLILDREFRKFSLELQAGYHVHDIVGVPPVERLDQEVSYLSMRGIPSSVNVFRYFGLMNESSSRVFCSNSVNLTLASETSLYSDLFSMNVKFGIITSHPGMADLLNARGADVDRIHLVPGDSRNFHLDAFGSPICQFPSYLRQIDTSLKFENLDGIVYLVAAGFVGKQYIKTIRERGGIALDVGSLADHWAKQGV